MSTAEQQALKFLTNQQDPELATLIHSQPLPAIAARITLDKLAQARMPLSYVALMQTLVSQQSEGAPEESSALALHCLVSKLTEMDSCFVCDVVLAMHAAGVSLNQPNTEKDTPLHLAARSGHLQLCQLLLQQGADPLARNSKNRCDTCPRLCSGMLIQTCAVCQYWCRLVQCASIVANSKLTVQNTKRTSQVELRCQGAACGSRV